MGVLGQRRSKLGCRLTVTDRVVSSSLVPKHLQILLMVAGRGGERRQGS